MRPESVTEQILDKMHAAILAADFVALNQMTPMLETALESVVQLGDPVILGAIERKASRNATCLLAASRGVRSALRRLAEVQGGAGLITYDGLGKRAEHGASGQLTRRF